MFESHVGETSWFEDGSGGGRRDGAAGRKALREKEILGSGKLLTGAAG
jgi:hypothetical protein